MTQRTSHGGSRGRTQVAGLEPSASMRWPHRLTVSALVVMLLAVLVAWHGHVMSDVSFAAASLAIGVTFAGIEMRRRHVSEQRLHAVATERQALARELDETQRQLQAMRRERTQVLAGLGHELRQPLQALRLNADEMLARQPDSPDADALRRQRRQADDAIGALDRFAEFIDIERGVLPIDLQAVNVREVIESVAAAQRTTHSGEAITIHTHGRDAWVRSDPAQLRRMVQALMRHAVRQSLRAEQPRHSLVVAAVRPQGDGYCIDIVDNDDGLEREEVERIFEPYAARSGDVAMQGQHGVGLAIVPGLVRQLGMRVSSVQSRRGRGTRLRIALPAALRWQGDAAPSSKDR